MSNRAETMKKDRNGNDVKVLRDQAVYTEDITWNKNTGNPIIDNSSLSDDLSLSIDFKGNGYSVRSPESQTRDS